MAGQPVILVTGASSGIGEATARLFGSRGYRVVLAARRLDRLEALQKEIEAQGGQALPVETDVSSAASIQAMVDKTLATYGQIDILFNNAGFGRTKWLEEMDPEKDIASQVQVNLTGVIQATRAVLPHMIARKSGHIINMGSQAAFVATPTYTVYAATKFGVRGFSDALRREVGVWGIKVSVIYPGGVATEFGQHTQAKRKTGITTPKALRLTPQQVAEAVLAAARRPVRARIMPSITRVAIWFATSFPGINDWLQEKYFTRPERGL
ncbi:MAG: SDR family oxidoreductase [Chloroflexi bacterium]|nr:SDR family oxidoreductase [Chloroflexota bacterium]